MENVLSNKYASAMIPIIAGALLLFVSSLARIPFYPVPMTLHTLAIFYLGLTQTPKQACGSALLYLAFGTLNPLWAIGKCGGYFLSFPLAAFLIAWSAKRMSSYAAIFWGQAVIYSLGLAWLIPFVGLKTAIIQGVVVFIPSAVVKAVLAVQLAGIRKCP